MSMAATTPTSMTMVVMTHTPSNDKKDPLVMMTMTVMMMDHHHNDHCMPMIMTSMAMTLLAHV